MKKFALILSGCGHLDGTEITEAVSLLVALSQAGADVTCFAPTNKMDESAQISRGQIEDLKNLRSKNFDALVLPGGYGAAKHLSNWAERGAKAEAHPEAARVIREFADESKPIGAACIAPTLLALVLKDRGITVTIGNDAGTAAEIEKTGARHESCPVEDYVTDRENKIVTTPAYMYDAKPHEVHRGISGMVKEVFEMA